MKSKHNLWTLALLLFATACEQADHPVQKMKALDDSPVYMDLSRLIPAQGRKSPDSRYALYKAEYLTVDGSGQIGRTIYFRNVGDKQLDADFVPGLSDDGTSNISYYIDENRPSADLPVDVTSSAIGRAMQTWENITCSTIGLYQMPSQKKISTGYVSALFGFGGSFDYAADVVHSGWLPGSFFDLLAPDGKDVILGVTFTLLYTDDAGELIDVDNNGKFDVAWREIYYNDNFTWADGATYDVETIALHEAGHGLSQDHFGSAFLDAGTNKLHFSPRAVMNAAYSGVQTEIGETDNAGHCSNWSSWPTN